MVRYHATHALTNPCLDRRWIARPTWRGHSDKDALRITQRPRSEIDATYLVEPLSIRRTAGYTTDRITRTTSNECARRCCGTSNRFASFDALSPIKVTGCQ